MKDSMPVDKKLEFTHAEGVQFVVDQFSGSAVLILLRSGSVVLVAPAPLVRLGPLQFVVQKRLVPMRSFRFQFWDLGFSVPTLLVSLVPILVFYVVKRMRRDTKVDL